MTEWNPNDYSRHSSLQQAMAAEQLALLVLNGTEHVLDVGCGVGNITAEIAARVSRGRVVGVDPSWDMISFASNLYVRQVRRHVHPLGPFGLGPTRRRREDEGHARGLIRRELPEQLLRFLSGQGSLSWLVLGREGDG